MFCNFLLLFLLAFPATGQNDPARGRLLYDTYCGACHYERVHQRMRTKIGDLGDLRDEVGRWSRETKRAWTLDELEDVPAPAPLTCRSVHLANC